MHKAIIMTISKNPQIGVSKKVIKIPKVPGSTRMKDGKIPIIERTPYKIFHHGSVVSFGLVLLKQFIHSKLKLIYAEKVSNAGMKKDEADGM